jgi:hypothetical protein
VITSVEKTEGNDLEGTREASKILVMSYFFCFVIFGQF